MIILKRLKNQESGMVLITVTAVVMVMSIFVVAFLSQNTTQTAATQDQVDQIKSKELCAGIIAKSISDLNAGAAIAVPGAVVMDGKTYNITAPSNATTILTATCGY